MNPITRSIQTAIGLGFALLTLAQAQPAFRAISLPDPNERVTGFYCASPKTCVISTEATDGGHIYATDGQKITATLVTGNSKFAEALGTLGTVGFIGFSKVGDRLIAHTSNAGGGLVSATGDFMQASAWGSVKLGVKDGAGGFGLNAQMGFGHKEGRWVYFSHRTIYQTSDTPSPGALWTPLWSPISPSFPRNFAELRKADPKLCEVEPGVALAPRLTQPGYVAPDLSLILYPSGSRNQSGSNKPGVCISTDGGQRFHVAEFAELKRDLGPIGVSCFTGRCLAFGGLDFEAESAYIYYSTDTAKGVASSWIKAKLPSLRENTKFRSVSIAPGSMNGWAVGFVGGAAPLLFSTSDGGATWQDVTSSIRALAPDTRLHTVYAFDASNVWIGGEKGLVLTSSN